MSKTEFTKSWRSIFGNKNHCPQKLDSPHFEIRIDSRVKKEYNSIPLKNKIIQL